MPAPDPAEPAFPAATHDDWRREAERVLKGRPLDSLTWRLEDGIEMSPVAPDSAPAAPQVPTVPTRVGRVLSCTSVEDGDEAAAALAAGFDLVHVCYDHDTQEEDLDELPLERTLLEPLDAVSATAALHDVPRAAGVVLGWWGWTMGIERATPAQQIGWLLSAAIDVLEETDDEAAPRLVLDVPVGVEIVTEIAKLRALRRLWADVAAERELHPRLRLLASCPPSRVTRLDPESNLLRAALAGFAAVAGGADVVEPTPYTDTTEAQRLTLQQMHLVRDEAGLDAVADPLAGSGTVEALTDALVRAGRAELDRLRALGGFLAAERAEDDARHERLVEPLREPMARRDDAVARRRRVIVGLNRFADPSRDAATRDDRDPVERYTASWREPGEPLSEFVGEAELAFEFLRERMVWHEDAGNARPTVVLLPLGPVAWRRARADFAADLFRAGGFAIDDAGGLDSVEEAVERAADAAVVVVCSDDASYADLAPRITAALPDARVIVAGRPPDGADAWSVAGFVHEGVDAVELLCSLQDDLGVGRMP